MKVVYKYGLRPGLQTLELPLGARILHVGDQYGSGMLWALVDPEQHVLEPRTLYVVGTGMHFDHHISAHLGTFQAGPFVIHVFEVRP